MIPLIIARPEPGNSETASAARALELEVIAAPLFKLETFKLNDLNSDNYDALFITSANSLRAAAGQLAPFLHLPLYAVGPASATAARDAGFETIIEGTADGAALAGLAAADWRRRLLHLAGNPHKAIAHPNLKLDVQIVYEMVELPAPDCLVSALSRPCVLLAHSPRIARTLANLTPDKRQCHLVAISAQAAEAAGHGWANSVWPQDPNSQAMLDLAAPLCRSA